MLCQLLAADVLQHLRPIRPPRQRLRSNAPVCARVRLQRRVLTYDQVSVVFKCSVWLEEYARASRCTCEHVCDRRAC